MTGYDESQKNLECVPIAIHRIGIGQNGRGSSENWRYIMNAKPVEWKPTCNRFVAYMDIMGFRDMIFRSTHQHVLEVMEQFRIPIKELKKEAKKRLRGESHGWDTFKNTVVRPVIFSDSVLLFSNDDSLGAFENLIWQVGSVIRNALMNGVPMKGAIAYGEQTADFDKSLYFGKPLIDAWELQSELVIYGVILHHTVEAYLLEQGWTEELEETSILKYATPLKQGTVDHYLVHWLYDHPMKSKRLRDVLAKLYGKVSGNPRQYVDNTSKYIEDKSGIRNLRTLREKKIAK